MGVSNPRADAMTDTAKTIDLAVTLTDAQAWHLAQFLKRVGFTDFRSNAQAHRLASSTTPVDRVLGAARPEPCSLGPDRSRPLAQTAGVSGSGFVPAGAVSPRCARS